MTNGVKLVWQNSKIQTLGVHQRAYAPNKNIGHLILPFELAYEDIYSEDLVISFLLRMISVYIINLGATLYQMVYICPKTLP